MNAHAQIELKHDTTILDATCGRFEARPIHFELVDCGEKLWVYGEEFGPRLILVARSWETAYEAAIDCLPTIDPSEVPEAYGFSSQAALDAAVSAAEDSGNYPDLIEGYQYQSNASGTGIVSVSHHEWLAELTPELMRDHGIKLKIGRWYSDMDRNAGVDTTEGGR